MSASPDSARETSVLVAGLAGLAAVADVLLTAARPDAAMPALCALQASGARLLRGVDPLAHDVSGVCGGAAFAQPRWTAALGWLVPQDPGTVAQGWVLVLLAGVFATGWTLARAVGDRAAPWLVGGLLLAPPVASAAWVNGSPALLEALLVAGAWLQLRQGHATAAGGLLGLLAAWRPDAVLLAGWLALEPPGRRARALRAFGAVLGPLWVAEVLIARGDVLRTLATAWHVDHRTDGLGRVWAATSAYPDGSAAVTGAVAFVAAGLLGVAWVFRTPDARRAGVDPVRAAVLLGWLVVAPVAGPTALWLAAAAGAVLLARLDRSPWVGAAAVVGWIATRPRPEAWLTVYGLAWWAWAATAFPAAAWSARGRGVERPRGASTPGRLELGVLVALAIVAFGWRAGFLLEPAESNEVGDLPRRWPWQVVADPESAVNPPLLRLLFSSTLGGRPALLAGRVLSLVASTGAVVAAWAVARGRVRTLGAGWALLAAGALALHPTAVWYGAMYRGYAAWTLLAAWHVAALHRAVEASPADRRGWTAQALAAALLLPWLHYLGVPVLVGFGLALLLGGRAHRRWAWVPLAGVVGVLPMAIRVLAPGGVRVPPRSGVVEQLVDVGSAGVGIAVPVFNALAERWPGGFDAVPAGPVWFALLFVGAAVVPGLRRGADPVDRTLALGLLALLGAVAFIARGHVVRPPVLLMVWVLAAPVVLVPRARVLSLAAWALVAWSLVEAAPTRLALLRETSEQRRAVWAVQEAVDALPPGAPVAVVPSWVLQSVVVEATGRTLDDPEPAGCPEGSLCTTLDGRWWQTHRTLGDLSTWTGPAFVVGRVPRTLPCPEVARGVGWAHMACGDDGD